MVLSPMKMSAETGVGAELKTCLYFIQKNRCTAGIAAFALVHEGATGREQG
jgi:hypothetical protein